MPTALGSACRPTRASVLSSHIEGLITSLSVLVQWPPLYAAPQVFEALRATLPDLSSPQQGRPRLAGVAYYEACPGSISDTPKSARIFPGTKIRLPETNNALARHCSIWSEWAKCTSEGFAEEVDLAGGVVIPFSEAEFGRVPFVGDRLEMRTMNMCRNKTQEPSFIDLGHSWLAPANAYKGSETRIKARPDWRQQIRSEDFVLLTSVVEMCNKYLQDTFVWPTGSADKAWLEVFVGSQLQEVDWWLGKYKSVAACETSILVKSLDGPPVYAEGQRKTVRAMLVFRAILLSVYLGIGMDHSLLVDTEMGAQIVLLR